MSFFNKLKDKLFKSSSKLDEGLDAIIAEAPAEAPAAEQPSAQKPGFLARALGRDASARVLDDAMLESLEELLIQSDMGVETAMKVAAALAEGWESSQAAVSYKYYVPAATATQAGEWQTGACPNGVRPDGLVQMVTITLTGPDARTVRTIQVVKSEV